MHSENSTLHSYDRLLVFISRHHCRMKRSDTWKYSYICSSLRATLHLRDIVKSGRARGTREETRKREGIALGERERISFPRLLAARFARPNRRACSHLHLQAPSTTSSLSLFSWSVKRNARQTKMTKGIILKARDGLFLRPPSFLASRGFAA